MPVEDEELRLSVTLDDQASAQLASLQAALISVGSAAGPAQQGLNQLAQSLRGAGGHAQQLQGSLGGMAAKGGFIAGFFLEVGKGAEQMAKDLANAVFNVKQYADAMVSLEQAARRANMSAAQFQRNVAIFREFGVSAADAAKNIHGFTAALGDLEREQSTIRSTLLGGLNPNEMAAMEQHIRRLKSSDRQAAEQEAKQFGIRIREAFEREGKPNRGATAQQEYYQLVGMPDLDKVRDPFEKITPQIERMQALRNANAERMQSAIERTSDASMRGVRSVQASALYALPITEAFELVGEVSKSIAGWLESWEDSIDKAGDALDKKQHATSGFWFEVFKKLGITGGRTRADEIGPAGPSQNVPGAPAAPAGPRTWRPGMRTQLLGNGGGLGSDTGLGVGLGVGGAVDRLPEEYEAIGGAMIEDRRGENATFPGRTGDPIVDNTTEMENLAYELTRLNDYLAPSNIMNPAFHNAPRGGARGESNPEKPPAGMPQPGGGAASEAVAAGDTPIARSMSEAMRYLERNESKDAAVLKDYMRTGGRNLTGDQNAWCARFVDAVQTRAGRPSLESSLPEGERSGQKNDSTWSSLAYKNWGRGVTPDEDIREGDVFVKQRKGGGHVGVATGNYRVNAKGDKEYEMLSGNIGGGKKGGGEVNITYETIGGRGGGEKTAGAGHGGVVSVRRGEGGTEVADAGPEEGGGKGKRLDPAAPPGAELAVKDNLARESLQNISNEPDQLILNQQSSLGRGEWPGGMQLAKRDAARNERAQGAAGDWLGEAAAPREREDRISSLDADVLDRAATSSIDVSTAGLLSVNVNAPKGTTVKAEGSGMLKQTEINRSMAMAQQNNDDA